MSSAPRGKQQRRVEAWQGLALAISKDRELRLNLLGAIVDATRAEYTRRQKHPGRSGEALVAEELKALDALEAEVLESLRRIDEARQRVALWSATITTGDRRGWGSR